MLIENQLQIYARRGKSHHSLKALEKWQGKKVVAFSPHADDLSIAAGGFLQLIRRDNQVQPVLGFTGWRGVRNGLSRTKAIMVREQEMAAEAKVLGIEQPIFLRLLSYESNDGASRRKDRQTVRSLIDQERPDVIFLPSEDDDQPRHRLLARYVLWALRQRQEKMLVVYYETPWSLFTAEQVNLLVPLDKEVATRKLRAVRTHRSQMVRTDFARISRAMLEYRALTVPEQMISGFGSPADLGQWVEVFRVERYKGGRYGKGSGA